jgi:hypothetical protein
MCEKRREIANMSKSKYEELEIEIIKLTEQDVLLSSQCPNEGEDVDPSA